MPNDLSLNSRFVGPKVAIFQDCGQMVGQSIVI